MEAQLGIQCVLPVNLALVIVVGSQGDGEVAGEFLMHKYKPKVYDKISSAGIHIIDDIFGSGD